MEKQKYDKEFKTQCVKYCDEHRELKQQEAARNLGLMEKRSTDGYMSPKSKGTMRSVGEESQPLWICPAA